MRHLVAISDIHLSEAEPTDGLWMRYRQKAYTPSAEIESMLEELLHRVKGDELELVLNGDVFDFDAPRVEGQKSVFHDLPRDAASAVPQVTAILRDHPEIVRGLGRVIAEGHKIVLISGNHDAQLTLPEVRDVVRAAIVRAASELSGGALTEGELAGRVEFHAWFYRSPEGVHFEHGHQYDSFCSFRYPMAPFGKRRGTIQPTLGSLVARLYMGRLGYFNPHVDASFTLSAAGHARHWIKYYLFTRQSQVWIWLSGALRVMASLVAHRHPGSREQRAHNLAAASAETGAPLRAVARHARLFATPSEDLLWMCAHELHLDRFALAGLALGGAAAWALSQQHAYSVLAALGPAGIAAVQVSQPSTTLEEHWRKVQRRARQVAKVHRAAAVVFGHTHTPEGAWEDGVFYGNTGSWSASYRDVACKEPLFDERPLIWLTSSNGGLSGGLCAWKRGEFRPSSPDAPRVEQRGSREGGDVW